MTEYYYCKKSYTAIPMKQAEYYQLIKLDQVLPENLCIASIDDLLSSSHLVDLQQRASVAEGAHAKLLEDFHEMIQNMPYQAVQKYAAMMKEREENAIKEAFAMDEDDDWLDEDEAIQS